MRFLILMAMSLSLARMALSQRHPGQYWSLGGYGNVLFPGTGHAPIAPPGAGGFFAREPRPAANDSQPPSLVIVPSPVYDADYSDDRSGISAPGETDQMHSLINPNPQFPVVVNQSFAQPLENPRKSTESWQDEPRPCANLQDPAPAPRSADQSRPTIYLIAFKDHTIVRALGYWMEAGTLHYISADYGLNQASMVRIDQPLSQRLNNERGIAFSFPVQK